MLPAGEATEATIERLGELLRPGDAIIDGGNTFWRDDLRRAKALERAGIHHIDVGTSGGILGAESGYCLMIGGEAEMVRTACADLCRARARRRDESAERGAGLARMSGRTAPGISSRWSTTASNTR